MDIKITGITFEIMEQALSQAKDGRIHILREMNKALSASRADVGKHTPKMEQINVDKKDIAAVSQTSSDAALARIRDIVAEPELNEIYDGKVVKTVDFGAFVNFLGARDGLVHISELKNERVAQTTDVVSEGDMVKVKVIGFDNRGKVKLSMKRVDQKTGVDIDTANQTEE